VRGQTGVFAGKNAALVGHELLEQSDILEIKRIKGEINLWFRTGCPVFHRALSPLLVFFFIGFAWHKLFDFAMDGITAQSGIVFFDFQLFRLELFVSGGGVA